MRIELLGGSTKEELESRIQRVAAAGKLSRFNGNVFEVLDSCNEKICFSKLTFPHQLIRIFLLEQIYRSFKIANNETYHK